MSVSTNSFFSTRKVPDEHHPSSSTWFSHSVRFDFYTELQAKLQTPAKVVPVFDKVKMQGERGAVATVDMPQGSLPHCCEITSLVAKSQLKNHLIPTRKPPGILLLPEGLLNLRPLGGICISQRCGKT